MLLKNICRFFGVLLFFSLPIAAIAQEPPKRRPRPKPLVVDQMKSMTPYSVKSSYSAAEKEAVQRAEEREDGKRYLRIQVADPELEKILDEEFSKSCASH